MNAVSRFISTWCFLFASCFSGAHLLGGERQVPQFQIRIPHQAREALSLHPRDYVPASIKEGRRTYAEIGVHLKGQYGTFQALDGKPSLTITFDRFVDGQNFHGLDKIHLNNSVSDPTYITEFLCRELFLKAGVPCTQAGHARVALHSPDTNFTNSLEFSERIQPQMSTDEHRLKNFSPGTPRDLGVYVMTEGLTKKFLARHFSTKRGNLYDSEFMHDVSYPLRWASGEGPDERIDLKALAAAAEEPDPATRLDRLDGVLHLDHFYSFLAMEILLCHFDGYARGINNYWLYNTPAFSSGGRINPPDSTASKFAFLPHGMDQMFYNPRSSVFPHLQGIVAKAVLSTAEGRKQYRERSIKHFNELFPSISNRVEEIRGRIRPEFLKISEREVAAHDRTVTNLQKRIIERIEHLRMHLTAPPPGLTKLEPGGHTRVTSWLPNIEAGEAAHWVDLQSSPQMIGPPAAPVSGRRTSKHRIDLYQPWLETSKTNSQLLLPSATFRLELNGSKSIASWETRIAVPRGAYGILAPISSEQKIFRGANTPIEIKLWGGEDRGYETVRPDSQHLNLVRAFAITSEEPEECIVQVIFQGLEFPVEYIMQPPILTRLE